MMLLVVYCCSLPNAADRIDLTVITNVLPLSHLAPYFACAVCAFWWAHVLVWFVSMCWFVFCLQVDSVLSSREKYDDTTHGTLTSVKTTLMQVRLSMTATFASCLLSFPSIPGI